jgi:ribosomal protein L37E
MPRRSGHKLGSYGIPEHIQHYAAKGHDLSAGKLTRRKRQLAQADHAVAEFFRSRLREPERFQAFIVGRTSYQSDTPCPRCGSTQRRVYAADCAACQNSRRPLHLDHQNRVATWPIAQRSRASFEDMHARRRRAAAGECEAVTFGDVSAWKHPDGRLTIEWHSSTGRRWRVEDANALPPAGAQVLRAEMHLNTDLLRVAAWDHWPGAADHLTQLIEDQHGSHP